jgi:hypothetical protein
MLTDAQCKNAVCSLGKPRSRLADSGGLYLDYRIGERDHQKVMALRNWLAREIQAFKVGSE